MNQLTKTIYDGLRERDVFKGDYSAFEATLQDDNVRKKLYRQLAISGILHNRSYDEFTADLGVSPKPDIPYPERVPEGPIYRTPPYDPVEAARMKLRNEHASKKRRSDALLDKMRQNPQDYPGGSQGMPKVLPMFGSSWDKITVQGEDLTKNEKEALQEHYKAEEQRLRKMAEEEDERLKDIHRKNLEAYDELPWYAKIGGPSYAINTHAADRMNAADPDYRMTEDIIRNLDTAADKYAAPTTFGDEWWITNVGRGIGNVVSDADFLTRGLTEARRQLTELGVKDKMNRILEDAEREGWDEETTSQKMYDALTDTERRLYASTMELMGAQAARSADTSLGYQAGQALAESAGYMLDFYLSGKLLNASPAFRNMTARALRSLHGRIAKDGGKALSALSRAEKAAYGAGKFGIRAADASAQTALRTAMFPSTYNEVLENRLEVDEKGRYVNSWASSLANGYTDSFLENLSEMSGPMMTRLLKFGGEGAKATAKLIASPVLKSKPVRKATEAYARKIRETGLSAAAREKKVLADALAKAGYYGPVEEYMEEVFNAVMMTAKGYITGNEEDKRQFGQFWTFDNNAVLVPTVMLPGAVTSTYNLIANRGAIKAQRQKEKTYSLYPWLRNSDEVNRWNAHELREKVNASTVPDGQDLSQGRIQQVQLTDGRTVYVTQGQLAFNMDNTVDGDNSADGVTVMDAKGRKSVVSTKGNGIRVEKLLSDMPYETEKRYEERQNEREARARYNYSAGKEVRFSDPITGELKTNPDGSPSTGTIIGIGDGVVRIDTHDPSLSDPVMVVSYTDLDAGKWLVPNRDGADMKAPEGGAYSFTVRNDNGTTTRITVEGVNSDGTVIASLRDKDGNFKGRETMTRAMLEWLGERKVQDTREQEQQQQPVTTEERQPQAQEQEAGRQDTTRTGDAAGGGYIVVTREGHDYTVQPMRYNGDGTVSVRTYDTATGNILQDDTMTLQDFDALRAQAKEVHGTFDTQTENPEPTGKGRFGNIYQWTTGKAKEAADFLRRMQSGYLKGVFHRNDIGDIDLVWGNDKGGLKHIIQKHIVEHDDFDSVEEAMQIIDDVLANGEPIPQGSNLSFDYNGYRVSVAKSEDGNWVLTAFDKSRTENEKKRNSQQPLVLSLSTTDTSDGAAQGVSAQTAGISTNKDTQSSQTTQDPVQEIADGTVSLMGSAQAAQKAMAHTVAEAQKKLAEVDRKIEAAEVVLTDPKSVKRYKDLQAQAQQLRQTIDSYTAAMERIAQPQAQPTGDTGTQEDATPEDVRSVPLYTEEDPKQGRTRGWRKTVSDIVRRPERVAAAKGGTTRVKFSTDTEQEGVHAVIEADELQPSHRQGVKNPYHFLDEAQPKDREGKDSVAASRKIAAGINPQEITGGVTAYTGSPSVNARGEVIQGNNRADALIYMYANEPEAAARYKQYLVEHADGFGLDAEKVASMSKPVLVNMLDVPDDRAIELGQLTSSDLESGGTQPISPSNVANQLASKGLADRYAGMLLRGEEDESISELVVRNGREALVFLRNVAGVINDTQYRSALREDGELTPEARVALADILTMQLLGGNKALRTMFGKLPAKAQKAIMATAYRDSQSNEADRMQDEIRASIIAFNSLMEDADFAKATNYEDARRAMEAAKRQMSWDFAANTQAALMQRFSNFALTLAAMYKGSTQRQIQATFNDIYNYVQGTGQMGLFDAEAPRPHSLEEAIRHVLELDYQPKNKQYYGNTRSDNVGGNSPQGEAGGQGSPRDVAIGEQGEAGERPANGGRGTEGNGGTRGTDAEHSLSQEDTQSGQKVTTSFIDVVRTIYSKGKDAAAKLFQRSFFDVAETPDFMRELGLRGDKFTIRYGVIARHVGKDGSHTLPEEIWEQLPNALQSPFAITKIKGKDNAYRIYTTLQTKAGEYVVVGADVKNAGREIEVNAIATVFGRRNNAGITTGEEVIYTSKKITPEQSALLERPDFAQYPTEEELSADKDTKNPETIQQITDAVEKLGLGVEIITSPSQLPKEEKKAREAMEKGAEVKGWYNAKTGKAYLYLPNAEDAADAVETVLHEVVAHKGLRGLLGKEGFDRLCDEVWDMMDAGQRRRFMAYVTRKRKMTETEFLAAVADGNKRREAADEYIAHLAESLDTEKLANESAWKKVLEAVRAFLGRMGIGRDANISDESITRLLQDSYRQLRRQKEGGNTENIIKENISKAESEVNLTPTEAQKKAGNYKKGHVRIDGYDITIEQPKGSTRSGTDENGKTWETKMNNTYGYIRGTQSVDGDHIDVFLSDNPTEGNVYVVDQIDQKTGEFDEHKVMYGFNSMEEAKNAYLSNYSKGWKIGNITEVKKEEFKKWVESSHRKTKPFSEYSSVNKQKQEDKDIKRPAAKIEDVGEKIGGARKDKVKEFAEKEKRVRENKEDVLAEIAQLPVSKMFNFDYDALRKEGVSNEIVTLLQVIKSAIPSKPRTPYKLRRWVSDVFELYHVALKLITLEETGQKKIVERLKGMDVIGQRYTARMALGGYDGGFELGDARLEELGETAGHYDKEGNWVSVKGQWYVTGAGRYDGIYGTKEKAIEALRDFAGLQQKNKGDRKVEFSIYTNRATGKAFITVKGNPQIIVESGFENASDARRYLQEHYDDLVRSWSNMKTQTTIGFKEQKPRKGKDWRAGRDVSADEFRATFGFRGVEFGNWANQQERQIALNNAYDALMDLSEATGKSPRAISLNGELGIAFGARGSGRAMAHYEPDKIVINLTKTMGAGTLAHEWWHAMDNYFARMRGQRHKYNTDRTGYSYDRTRGTYSDEERREITDAFKELNTAIELSGYGERSKKYASLKSSYWSRPTELGARAFEAWVNRKLSEKGTINDFLATPPMAWENNGLTETYYPYPIESDFEKLDTAFENLFDTMQEKVDEETGNVVLFNIAPVSIPSMTDSQQLAFDAVSSMLENAGIDVKVMTNEQMQQLAGRADAVLEARIQSGQHQTTQLMTVYHGSGAEFSAFDHSHMGEGEGAQAYGWGSYVTEVKGIGRTYAESQRKTPDDIDDIVKSGMDEWDSDMDNVIETDDETRERFGVYEPVYLEDKYRIGDADEKELALAAAEYYGEEIDTADEDAVYGMTERLLDDMTEYYNDRMAEKRDEYENDLRNSLSSDVFLYTVEIPDNTGSNYLEWEKPLTEAINKDDISKRTYELASSGNFQDEVEREILERDIRDSIEDSKNGKDLYKAISLYIGDKETSMLLHDIGFSGISYPAQYTTGGRSDGARNYVIFNEKDLQIKDRIQFMRGKRKVPDTRLPEDESSFKGTVVSSTDGAKIIKNLDILAKEKENNVDNRPRSFLGDVAKALGARQHGSKSQYATFETVNGQVVTIRLSDHNASTLNFDNAGRENGISIVISRKPNQGITNDGNARLVEFFYPDKALQKADGKPLVEIIKSIKQALYSGEYTDTTGLAERQEVNAATQEVRGDIVYGATVGGKIYLNGEHLNPESPIHEYTHLWDAACQKNNPELWKRGVELMKQTPLWEEVNKDPNYDNLTTDDEIASEVHSRLTGKDGAALLERMAAEMADGKRTVKEAVDALSVVGRLKKWLSDFWYWLKDTMTPWTRGEAEKASLEDFVNMPLKDLARGTDLRTDGGTDILFRIADEEAEKTTNELREAADNATYDNAVGDSEVPVMPKPGRITTLSDYLKTLSAWNEAMERRNDELIRGFKDEFAKNMKLHRQLYRKFVDAARPLENFQNFVVKNGGTLRPQSDAYGDLFASNGRATYKTIQFENGKWKPLEKLIKDMARNINLKSIDMTLTTEKNGKTIRKKAIPYDIISLYLRAKDILEAQSLGMVERGSTGFAEVTGMAPAEFAEMVESIFTQQEIDNLWRNIKDCTSFSLDMYNREGMLSDEKYDEFMRRGFYVPQRGWEQGQDEYEYDYDGMVRGSRFTNPLTKAEGRRSLASDPLKYIYSMATSSILATERNAVKRKFLQFIRDNISLGIESRAFDLKQVWFVKSRSTDPETGLPLYTRTYVQPSDELLEEDRKSYLKIDELKKQLSNETDPEAAAEIRRQITELRDNMNVVRSTRARKNTEDGVIRVVENGVEYEIRLNAREVSNTRGIVDVLERRSKKTNAVLRWFGRWTRKLTSMLTQYDPAFALANFVRDYLSAFVTNTVQYGLGFSVKAASNTIKVMRAVARHAVNGDYGGNGEYSGMLREFFENGGATGFTFLRDIGELEKDLRAEIGRGRLMDSVVDNYGRLKKGLAVLTEISEVSVRFGEYVTSRKQGKTIEESVREAKEVTTNFDRKGSSIGIFSPFFGFLNASIQGNNRMFRLILDKHGKKLAAACMGFMVLGIVNTLLNPDDPDEGVSLTDYDRMSNLTIGNFKIPLPHFFRGFWGFGVQLALWMQGKKNADEFLLQGLQFLTGELVPEQLGILDGLRYDNASGRISLDPVMPLINIMPTVLQPLFEAGFNRDFTGGRIYKENYLRSMDSKIPKTQLGRDDESPALRYLTDWLANVSGGSATARTNRDIPFWADVNPSALAHVIEGYSPGILGLGLMVVSVAVSQITGEEYSLGNYNLVGRFYRPYDEGRTQERLYWKLKKKADRFKYDADEYFKAKNAGDGNAARLYEDMATEEKANAYYSARQLLDDLNPDNEGYMPSAEGIRKLQEQTKEWNKIIE